MSWKREGDTVTLTMSVDDWEGVLLMMGIAIGAALRQRDKGIAHSLCRITNRVSDGNPDFTPYNTPEGTGLEARPS